MGLLVLVPQSTQVLTMEALLHDIQAGDPSERAACPGSDGAHAAAPGPVPRSRSRHARGNGTRGLARADRGAPGSPIRVWTAPPRPSSQDARI